MLFITNRRIEGSRRSQAGRTITFAPGDNEPGASLFFCQRQGPDQYLELTAVPFFGRLRRSVRRQVLFFVHGYNCQPEARVFPEALQLQRLCDALAPDLVEVVPLVWPCDDDFGLVLDYWDDQHSATASGMALARVLGKFMAWRDRLGTEDDLPQARQRPRPLDGQPRPGDRPRLLGARLRRRAGAVPQRVHGRGRRRQRRVRGRPARRRDRRRRPQRRRLPCRRRSRAALQQGRRTSATG